MGRKVDFLRGPNGRHSSVFNLDNIDILTGHFFEAGREAPCAV